MRQSKNLLSILITTFLMVPICLLAQQTHVVNLTVNTADIDRRSIADNSSFGQTDDTSNEDYTILVSLGDTIVWQGLSSSNPTDHIVNIKSINHVGGARLFDRNVLNGDNGTPQRVIGIITEGRSGDEKKYNIFFKLSNKRGTFKIDPKIRMN